MRQADIDRIAELDIKIEEADRIYNYTLEQEKAQNKKHLLLSKAYKEKRDRLVRERSYIQGRDKQTISKRFSWEKEMNQRNYDLRELQDELVKIQNDLIILSAGGLVNVKLGLTSSADFDKDIRTYQILITKQKVLIARKERAINTWKAKEYLFPIPPKKPRFKNEAARLDAISSAMFTRNWPKTKEKIQQKEIAKQKQKEIDKLLNTAIPMSLFKN